MNSEGAYELAELIRSVKQIVVLTGAGISTESGIPDFRSPGGVWENYRPVTIQEFMADGGARRRYWAYKKDTFPSMSAAEPNAGHLAVGELERRGKLQALITQNIDGLDEKTGLNNLIEIHGNRTKLRCIECGDRISLGSFVPMYAPKPCEKCDGLIKFDTVMFGEPIPDDVMIAARTEINQADCVVTIGTSGTVRPASGLIWIAESAGSTIVEINPNETKLTSLSKISLRSTAGVALPLLSDALIN